MLSGLTQYVPEATLTVYDNLEFLIRLLLSAALGALVGLERSKRRKEAGIRTHCIIACTSALFMIVSKYAFLDCVTLDGLRGADPARIAAQVVSGISFLGAGVIFKNGNSIRGLTTPPLCGLPPPSVWLWVPVCIGWACSRRLSSLPSRSFSTASLWGRTPSRHRKFWWSWRIRMSCGPALTIC